ncbi:MAG: pantetheine-phosphate adenylyltransferase [Myxococcaceae bacterium]|nr:pantetheine-phosphate adenylyltransferase [Myxococcaceae bacterium]
MRIAVYAGSFDPVTSGHLDVIEKARALADTLHVVVAMNPEKTGSFSVEERVALLQACVPPSVVVTSTPGLVIDYARSVGARWLVRGVRSVTDAEAELRLASLNATLAPELTTVFVNADPARAEVSSSRLKELAREGADLSAWCHPVVAAALHEHQRRQRPRDPGSLATPVR